MLKATSIKMSAPCKEDIIKVIKQGNPIKIREICGIDENKQCIKSYYHVKTGDNVLSFVCRQDEDNVSLLSLLHKSCNLDLEQGNFEGKRPIHEAAQFGSLQCLNYLLNSHVAVDTFKKADWTPLMLACTKPKLEIILELIKHGANPALENKDGWNAFHIACREGHFNIVQFLLEHCNDTWDTVSKNGRTPLHTVALHGRTAVVKYLLKHCNYKVDVKDSCGTTPFMDAIRAGFVEVADILYCEHHADIHAMDNLGRQALHLACEAGSEKSVLYLLDKHQVHSDLVSSVSGGTPLHLACKEGHDSVVKLLLQYGANLHLKDKRSRTALHIASGSQHLKCVEILLQHGAHDYPDASGTEAKDLTIKQDIQQLFLKYGQG